MRPIEVELSTPPANTVVDLGYNFEILQGNPAWGNACSYVARAPQPVSWLTKRWPHRYSKVLIARSQTDGVRYD